MKKDTWKFALLGVGVIALITSVVLTFGGNGLEQRNSLTYVDVTDGQLYEVPLRGRSLMIPMQNPETEAWSLLPVEQREDDTWYVPPRYIPNSTENLGFDRMSAIQDVDTGSVRTNGETPISLPKN